VPAGTPNSPGAPQIPSETATVTPPAAPVSYAALLQQAQTMLQRRNVPVATTILQQAVDSQPNEPRAYELLGQMELAQGDVRRASEHYRAAVQKGGSAEFHVIHDNFGGQFTNVCKGVLKIRSGKVAFVADDAGDSFEVPVSQVKEARRNRVGAVGKVIGGVFRRKGSREDDDIPDAFHIRTTSKNYNLLSAAQNRPQATDLILNLIRSR
jgi:hypothetical protein